MRRTAAVCCLVWGLVLPPVFAASGLVWGLAHGLGHLYGAVGVFDPKVNAYVVAITHDPGRPLGSWIPASDVN